MAARQASITMGPTQASVRRGRSYSGHNSRSDCCIEKIRDVIGSNLACRATGCQALERYTFQTEHWATLYAQFGVEAQKRLAQQNTACTITYVSDMPGVMPKDYGKNTKKCTASFPLHQTWNSFGCGNIECGRGSGTACTSDKKCPIK